MNDNKLDNFVMFSSSIFSDISSKFSGFSYKLEMALKKIEEKLENSVHENNVIIDFLASFENLVKLTKTSFNIEIKRELSDIRQKINEIKRKYICPLTNTIPAFLGEVTVKYSRNEIHKKFYDYDSVKEYAKHSDYDPTTRQKFLKDDKQSTAENSFITSCDLKDLVATDLIELTKVFNEIKIHEDDEILNYLLDELLSEFKPDENEKNYIDINRYITVLAMYKNKIMKRCGESQNVSDYFNEAITILEKINHDYTCAIKLYVPVKIGVVKVNLKYFKSLTYYYEYQSIHNYIKEKKCDFRTEMAYEKLEKKSLKELTKHEFLWIRQKFEVIKSKLNPLEPDFINHPPSLGD